MSHPPKDRPIRLGTLSEAVISGDAYPSKGNPGWTSQPEPAPKESSREHTV